MPTINANPNGTTEYHYFVESIVSNLECLQVEKNPTNINQIKLF